jgi:hypothetical protein
VRNTKQVGSATLIVKRKLVLNMNTKIASYFTTYIGNLVLSLGVPYPKVRKPFLA